MLYFEHYKDCFGLKTIFLFSLLRLFRKPIMLAEWFMLNGYFSVVMSNNSFLCHASVSFGLFFFSLNFSKEEKEIKKYKFQWS